MTKFLKASRPLQTVAACGLSALCFSTPSVGATIESSVTASFSTTTGSLFGEDVSIPDRSVRYDFGSDTGPHQFRNTLTRRVGVVNSDTTFGIDSRFESEVTTGRTLITLDVSSVNSSFNSQTGVGVSSVAEQRWDAVNLGLTTIPADSNKFVLADTFTGLDVSMDRLISFGSEFGFFRGADRASVGINVPVLKSFGGLLSLRAGITHNFTQITDFFLEGLRGDLTATNTVNGETVSSSVNLTNKNAQNFSLDLLSEGLWDIELKNLQLDHRLETYLYDEVRQFAGIGFGTGCGDPTTNLDNTIFCSREIPFFLNSNELKIWDQRPGNRPATQLNLSRVASLSLGQINVSQVEPVPLPVSAWMLLAAFGCLGWKARQKQS